MAYTKTNWVNNTTPLNATNMNKIEEGIAANDAALNTKASVDYVNKTHYGYSGDDLLIIPEGTTTIANDAYRGTNYKCVVIPDSVTSIGTNAFSYCMSLMSITIPDSVTSIGNNAFEHCHDLTSVTIPKGVTDISYGAFQSCFSLTSVTIGNGVTSIGDYAFYNCPLVTIDLTAYTTQSFPTLGTDNFNDIASNYQIKVVKGRKAALIATSGWSSYASYVVEVPTVETLDTAIAAVKNGYLPLSGGTLTGDLKVNSDVYVKNTFYVCKDAVEPTPVGGMIYTEWDSSGPIFKVQKTNNGVSLSAENGGTIEFGIGMVTSRFTGISDSIGDSSTIAVSQKCLKEALDNSRLPISAGTGTNSLVGNDLSTNTAISENAVSFGTNNKGGLKGYYWSAINLSAKTITLASAHTGGTAVNCEYAVGNTISIVNGAKYNNCSRITAISSNVVTVDSFPFTKIESETPAFDNYCIYCNAKPAIGTADLGKNAVVFGDNNKSGNRSSFIAGRDNAGVGQYAFAAGRENTVAYASFAAGRNNNISHDYSCGIGWNNTSGGQVSTLIGYGNTGRGNYNFLIGASNDTSKNVTEQISIGFANHSEAKTTFSIGKNNKHYLPNGIIIGTNNIGQGGVCLGDNNTVGKNQYTVGKNNRENFRAANVYRFGESLQPNANQTIVGRYNKQVSSTSSFIVGIGTSDTDRKNGMWVTSDGNLSVGGSKLTLNGNGSPTAFTADDLTNTANTATAAKNAVETIKKTYLPLSGGTMTGALEVAGSISVNGSLSVSISDGAGVSVSDEHSAVLLSNTGLEDPTGTWRFAGSIFSTEDLIAG